MNHITLTGNLGSGKSTVCGILEEKYGFEPYATGKVQRKIAEEMGISVLEMNKLMKKDHKYDHLIDDTTAKISRENPDKKIVFDSRLAWNFVEKSFKVFLSVDIDESTRRVFSDASRGNVEKYSSLEDCKNQLIARATEENTRYHELYNLNYFDYNNYDLVLDSTYASPDQVVETLAKEAEAFDEKADKSKGHILLSPKRLLKEIGIFVDESGDVSEDDKKKYADAMSREVFDVKSDGFSFEPALNEEDQEKLIDAVLAGVVFVRCRLV